MNETITIDGKEYEVLTLDRIGEITHAKLAGGKVVEAESDAYCVTTQSPCNYAETRFGFGEIECFGIQPLKLIERKPVEFLSFATLEHTDRGDLMVICATHEVKEGMKFRCVQITEEA